MCAHDDDATVRVIGALEAIGDPPGAALNKLAHIVAANELWMHRFGARDEAPESIFPIGEPLDEIKRRATQARIWRARFFDGFTDEKAAEVFAYTSTEGSRHRSTLADILTHLCLHGQYHRGQIMTLVKKQLPDSVTTDYIYFTRENL
jgi:uncharacterized damage-inducible protein DinB